MLFARPKTRLETPMATTASLPSGQRVYAIGDIHGRLDLLQALSSKLRNDIQTTPAKVRSSSRWAIISIAVHIPPG